MFVRASEPRAYLEEDQHRPDRGLDYLPLAQPRLLRPVFPRSQIGHTFLPVCPANHLFGHTHLSNNPLASAWGCLRKGGEGCIPSSFPQVPPRSSLGPSSSGVTFRMTLADPWDGPTCEVRNPALSVLSRLFFRRSIFVVVCVAMVVMQQLCNT